MMHVPPNELVSAHTNHHRARNAMRKRLNPACIFLTILLLFSSRTGNAQGLIEQFEQKVTEFTLDNGLDFIIIERHEAPVASFFTYADVGSVNEVKGITGLAHVFEHMAFKGTTTIGTKDLQAELAALKKEDEVYDRLRQERQKGVLADTALIARLEAEFEAAVKEAQGLVRSNEFDEIVTRAGAVGLNASTSSDATQYYYSLPSNKAELWFALEADRFTNPVLREFYVERDVVMEERRMRTESNPFGRLLEEFLSTAFKAHPYGEPVVGHMSDLQTLTRAEAEDFFKKYYGPQNLTIAIAGDVDPEEMRKLAEQYFGSLPAGEKPESVETIEPPQIAERRVILPETSQPILMVGWHRGSIHDPDDLVYDVLGDILYNGRTSRLYKRLVEEDQFVLEVDGLSSFPGSKYPTLFLIYAIPNQGRSPEEVEQAIYQVLEDIKTNGVMTEELERAQVRLRASVIRQLGSNMGLAANFAFYKTVTGDWRNQFRQLDRLASVTVEDVQRVAASTFVQRNRTVGMVKTEETESTASAGAP